MPLIGDEKVSRVTTPRVLIIKHKHHGKRVRFHLAVVLCFISFRVPVLCYDAMPSPVSLHIAVTSPPLFLFTHRTCVALYVVMQLGLCRGVLCREPFHEHGATGFAITFKQLL